MAQPTWITPAGNFGTYTEGIPLAQTFVATASDPLYTLEYAILNSTFPNTTFLLDQVTGVLTGTPSQVQQTTNYNFTIRVKEYYLGTYQSFNDRTFSFTVTGVTPPTFITPAGALYSPYLLDSAWDPFQIVVDNPDPNTTAVVRLYSGNLPPGLEIDSTGYISGYANPPTDGLGNPTTTTSNFTLEVKSESGLSSRSFSITVKNQQQIIATDRQPSILNTRPPSEYNISSAYIMLDNGDWPYFAPSSGFLGEFSQDNFFIFRILGYSFGSDPVSYSITGTLPSGLSTNVNYNSNNVNLIIDPLNPGSGYNIGDQLKILGSYVGGVNGVNDITFTVDTVDIGGELATVTAISGLNCDSGSSFSNVPITTVTGAGSGAKTVVQKINASWILGTINTSPTLFDTYSFTATAQNNTTMVVSDPITFSMNVVAQTSNVPFNPIVQWITNPDLGTIYNGAISSLVVEAESLGGLTLNYTLISGALPPDLVLNANGQIEGRVSFEASNILTPINTEITFTFEIQAANGTYPAISASRQFTVTVYQNIDTPYENLYMRALLSPADRIKLGTLVDDTDIIPTDYLYRPTDPYFGKTTVESGIVYQHMYGVPASLLADYIAAVNENFYWKDITLGPIKTAKAKNENNETVYEVVYSEIIDDLINNEGISISKEFVWPQLINGVETTVYPNSLQNMREQIAAELGQIQQQNILPLWMTCSQDAGGSLGFIQAWVICYTKPGYSEYIKNNIVSPLTGEINVFASSAINNTLECNSTVGFYPNMKIQFTGTVFGGVSTLTSYYIQSIHTDTLFSISTVPNSPTPMVLTSALGNMQLEQITWQYTLNELQFKLDRFAIDKSFTYEYDVATSTWSIFPSSTVTTDVENAFVFFPKRNILN